MSKFGLGRGLGNLMKGDKVAGQIPPASNGQSEEQNASSGVDSLLRKPNVFAEPQPRAATESPEPKRKQLIPLWYFFVADLLLIFFAALILWKSPAPTWKEITFCIVAIALGGALSVMAVLRRRLDSEE